MKERTFHLITLIMLTQIKLQINASSASLRERIEVRV